MGENYPNADHRTLTKGGLQWLCNKKQQSTISYLITDNVTALATGDKERSNILSEEVTLNRSVGKGPYKQGRGSFKSPSQIFMND